MSAYIFIIFLIISVAGLLLFWLFFRQSNNIQSQAQNYLLSTLKDQSISSEQRHKLEKQLSDLLQKKENNSSLKMTILIAVFLIPSSYVFYTLLGNPAAVDYSAYAQQNQEPQITMQEANIQLEAKLAKNPNDVDGQVLYARSLVSMKAYDKAIKAYRKANELAPNESVILTELAESIALFNDNRSFLGEPETFLKQAVAIDDTNQKALWLLGMTFYERNDLAKTNELWSKLYSLMTNESAKSQLMQQLDDVRNKLGLDSPSSSTADTDDVTDVVVNMQVNLDSSLQESLQGKPALLYIYAKAATGMPMPIAVIRKPLQQISKPFPIILSMSDTNNLQPDRKLSDFESIIIGARISFSGNAMPQSGDLQSTEIKVDLPHSKTVNLIIDKVK
ncbi:MAG: hypothetical protein JKY19_11955 [Alcanivoracaceae bacterium]|nr:hypothetical protein [Alcanivoracaceae bacterium]